jgi:hypothetical protein
MLEFLVATKLYQSKKLFVLTVLQLENGIQMEQYLVMLMKILDKLVNLVITISIQLLLQLHL